MSIRSDIITILSTGTYPVEASKVEPLSDNAVISIQNVSQHSEHVNGTTYFIKTNVSVIAVINQQQGYDITLDDCVSFIKTAILTNSEFLNKFNDFPEFKISYDYKQAGETNQASAIIDFTFCFNETYEPLDISADLITLHVDTDYIQTPSDINLFTNPDLYPTNPDGRHENEQTFTLT